jgi:hypothetical protein
MYSQTDNEKYILLIHAFLHKKYGNIDFVSHPAFSINAIKNNEEISKNDKYSLITAPPQSGKTVIILITCIMYMIYGYTPIIILPKSPDIIQFKSRLTSIIEEIFDSSCIDMLTNVLYSSSSKKISDIKLMSAMSHTKPGIIICLKEHTQITRVVDIGNCVENRKLVLFIDEAHVAGGYKKVGNETHDPDVKYDVEINKLKLLSGKNFLITATSANILFAEQNLYQKNVYCGIPSKNYRGLEHVEFIEMKKNNENTSSEIECILGELLLQYPIHRKYHDGKKQNSGFHPIILLCHAELLCKDQKKWFELSTDWLIATFQGEGICLKHDSILENPPPFSHTVIDSHILIQNIQPCEIIEWVISCGARFSHTCFMAYNMAEESVSFSTNTIPSYHLTHLYMAGTTSSARTQQIILRLGGNHGDNIKLKLFTSKSNKEKIIKEFVTHKNLIDEICMSKTNYNITESMKNKKHLKVLTPNKFLTLKKLGLIFNRVKTKNDKQIKDTLDRNSVIGLMNDLSIINSPDNVHTSIKLGSILLIKEICATQVTQAYNMATDVILTNYGTGVWVKRPDVVKLIEKYGGLGGTGNITQTIKARFTDMTRQKNHTIVDDENTIGLLMRSRVSNRWEMIVN